MQKLITAYRNDRSDKNATKLAAYNARHLMAACLLSADDVALLNEAIAQAAVNHI